jgi:hypothetical protein
VCTPAGPAARAPRQRTASSHPCLWWACMREEGGDSQCPSRCAQAPLTHHAVAVALCVRAACRQANAGQHTCHAALPFRPARPPKWCCAAHMWAAGSCSQACAQLPASYCRCLHAGCVLLLLLQTRLPACTLRFAASLTSSVDTARSCWLSHHSSRSCCCTNSRSGSGCRRRRQGTAAHTCRCSQPAPLPAHSLGLELHTD